MARQSTRLVRLVAAALGFWSVSPTPAPAADFPVGASPSAVAVGDFNGDRKSDLAVANNGSDNVSVLLGNGNGTFLPAVNYPVGSCRGPDQRSFPWSVAAADFDGDQVLDLVVATSGCHTVSVLKGNGDGTFQPAREFSAGISPVFVAVGDFNGDRVLDLAVADQTGGVWVLLGNGDGTFQAAVSYATGKQSWSVAVDDFDRDGRLDLAVTNAGDPDDPNNPAFRTVSVLLGNGDGTFKAAVNYSAGKNPRSVVVGDFNGDGNLDLAVANFDTLNSDTDDVSVLLGKGDGTFQSSPINSRGGTGSLSWVHPISVAVHDFNGDSVPDLAVTNIDRATSYTWRSTSSVSALRIVGANPSCSHASAARAGTAGSPLLPICIAVAITSATCSSAASR